MPDSFDPSRERRRTSRNRSAGARGFTLIEMLLVIGIIVVLISILVPAISKMRKMAYDTKTRALMAKIATACHAYYGDWHAYPGLFDETVPNTSGSPNLIATTYGPSGPKVIDNITQGVTASESLALSLLGGLQATGVPPAGQPATYHFAEVGMSYDPSVFGKGAISLNPANPRHYDAYIQLEPGEVSDGQIGFTVSGNNVTPEGDTLVPEFVDAWPWDIKPTAIIYMRARVGGQAVVNDTSDPNWGGGQNGITAQYRYQDFEVYASPGGAMTFTPPAGTNADAWNNTHYSSYFDMLKNPTYQAGALPEIPRGRDSFILVAKGMSRNWTDKDLSFVGE